MSAHAPAHRRPRGRWVRLYAGAVVIARPVPPPPRSSAIVDPRIGDLGPALLALEDGTVFPGVAFGAPVAAGGDLVVNTSQTGYQEVCTDPSYAGQVVVMTYPLIGNYGRLVDDDQSRGRGCAALVVANATAAVLDDARQLARAPARRRHPGHRRRRHPGARPPPARERLPARRSSPRPATSTATRPSRRAAGRAALGGPGLRRPGLAGRRSRTSATPTRAARCRDRRLRAEVEHRPRRCAAAAPASGSCRTRSRRADRPRRRTSTA